MPEKEMGVVGLATMGMNLARNLASHGVRIAVYNRTRQRTDEFMSAFGKDGDFHAAYALEDLKRILRPPRAVLVMVKAGAPVDESIDSLTKVLEKGDTIIDGGNSFFQDTQLIAETYDLLHNALGLSADELASVFREWNNGRLQSYLIEITSYVLAKHDDGARSSLVDAIEDEADQKGTGRWTSQSALELGVPLTGITEAVFARMLSSQKAQRVRASNLLQGPGPTKATSALIDDIQEALYASKIVAYAQGFEHLAAGSKEH